MINAVPYRESRALFSRPYPLVQPSTLHATLNSTRNPQPATLLRVGLRLQRILDTLRRQYNNYFNHNYCYQANERRILEHYKLVIQSYYT